MSEGLSPREEQTGKMQRPSKEEAKRMRALAQGKTGEAANEPVIHRGEDADKTGEGYAEYKKLLDSLPTPQERAMRTAIDDLEQRRAREKTIDDAVQRLNDAYGPDRRP